MTNMYLIFDAQQAYFLQNGQYLTLPQTPQSISKTVQRANFDQDPWSKLALKIDPFVHYTYEVIASYQGSKASFEIFARGDIDGDGKISTFKLKGSADPNGKPLGRNLLYKLDPLE